MISILFSVLMTTGDMAAATPAPATAGAEAPKAERKICKRDSVTESRVGIKKTCLTAAQWKARDSGISVQNLGDLSK